MCFPSLSGREAGGGVGERAKSIVDPLMRGLCKIFGHDGVPSTVGAERNKILSFLLRMTCGKFTSVSYCCMIARNALNLKYMEAEFWICGVSTGVCR